MPNWQQPEGDCPGRRRALAARNLVELLLDAPAAWLDKTLLLDRRADGSWRRWSWVRVQQAVLRLAAWLEAQGVGPGDRVGLLGHNRPEWCIADFAILRLGAVTVPAYYTDPAANVQFVFRDAGVKLALVEEGEQAAKLEGAGIPVLVFRGASSEDQVLDDPSWDREIQAPLPAHEDLATIIYTSGTTGRPKGVMLTHGAILADVAAGLGAVPVYPDDRFLSFLPLAHAFERTVGQFLAVASGAEIAYAESLATLMRDFAEVRPTLALAVPRLCERVHAAVAARIAEGGWIAREVFARAQSLGWKRFQLQQQGKRLRWVEAQLFARLDALAHAPIREQFGGRLRALVVGGAALSPEIARFLLAAGITVLPGYGLTEAAPTLSVNRARWIKPETVGPPLPGVELKIAADGELLARGAMIMQGYWNLPEETEKALDDEGWLHTGDVAEMDADGFVRIVDRKKEIMVLSTGENVPPAVIEQRLVQDPVIAQVAVVADGRPYVGALVVVDEEALARAWREARRRPLPRNWREDRELKHWLVERMNAQLGDLPRFMRVRRLAIVKEPWTQEAGLLTPTLKLKRRPIYERHHDAIEAMFSERA